MNKEKLYESIVSSIKNEIVVNEHYMKILSGRTSKFGFPGASRLPASRLDGRFFGRVLYIFYLFWPIFISPLVNFYLLMASLRFKLMLKGSSEVKTPRVLIFVSGDTTHIVQSKAIGGSNAILYRPRQKAKESRDCDLDSLQLLSFIELLKVYLEAVYCTIRFSYEYRFSSNRLYSIFFFDLIVVAKAFERLGDIDELYSGDHFDRWAVLLDIISSDKKRVGKFSIVQHGSLKDSTGQFPIMLPVKLKSVGCLYCFDDESFLIFKNSIISTENNVSVRYFGNSIVLSGSKSDNVATILIVGNLLCLEFHVAIAKAIVCRFGNGVSLIYKPHPTQQLKSADNEFWQLILDSQIFPEVDLVVSYPSTLVDQYREHNISVVVHPIAARENDIEPVIKEVSRLLELKTCAVIGSL